MKSLIKGCLLAAVVAGGLTSMSANAYYDHWRHHRGHMQTRCYNGVCHKYYVVRHCRHGHCWMNYERVHRRW